MDLVNEVLYFDKIESSKNSKNEKFSFFLEGKERNIVTEKSVAKIETIFDDSQRTLNSVVDSEDPIDNLNIFIMDKKDFI